MGNASSASKLPPLKTVADCSAERMMGIWFVIAVKPTAFETKNSNAVERYTWREKGNPDFDIDFSYNAEEPLTSPLKSVPQKGWIDDANTATIAPNRMQTKTGNWKVSPLWPLKLSYLLLEVDIDNYSYCVVGYPSRAYCWIMSRTPQMKEELFTDLTTRLKDKHQYDLEGLRMVPQKWTKAEREKRNLVQEIPDSMLEKE